MEMHIDGEVLSEPQSIELDGSLDVRVNCKASGSNPQPQVHLVAENEAGEQLDLTHYLAEQESEVRMRLVISWTLLTTSPSRNQR